MIKRIKTYFNKLKNLKNKKIIFIYCNKIKQKQKKKDIKFKLII